VSIPVACRVANRTRTGQSIQVTLEVDGGQPIRKTTEIEAGGESEVLFEVTFRETGQHRLRTSIDGDGLAADNERFAVVDVREKLRLLIVEGSSENDPSLRESTHLLEVLDPTGGEGAPDLTMFAPHVVDKIRFLSNEERLTDYDVVVLANVDYLNEASARSLTDAVQSGTGLFAMFGDGVNTESFNVWLHGSGTGPMPMRLFDAEGFSVGGDRYYGSEIRALDHPVFADLDHDIHRQIFESLPIWRFVQCRPELAELGSVLAVVRDASLSPLLIASGFGTGKSAFLTSAISRRPDRWNRLDSSVGGISFLFLHPLIHWLAQPATDPRNVLVGQSLAAVLDSRPFNLAVVMPERSGQGKTLVGEDAKPVLGDRYALPPFATTSWAGVYEIEMLLDQSGNHVRHQEFFAVNVDPAEGELAYWSHEIAREQLGVARILAELPTASGAAVQAGISDLGPSLLALLLALLVGEAALARWVSRRRA
jgi:hypothetical protein